jgi:hypothetical protein
MAMQRASADFVVAAFERLGTPYLAEGILKR